MAVSIVLLCSFKKLALIELLFPAFYLLTAICILVVQFGHIFGEPTDLTRQQAVFMIIFIHCIFTLFSSATFSSGFLARILMHIPFGTLCVAERRRHNAEMNFAQSWVIGTGFALMLELSVYINMKAKSKLFLKTKQSEQ